MKWFKEVFIPSFKKGTTRISEKQADIFKKYLKDSHEQFNAEYFTDTLNGLTIVLQDSLVLKGYKQYYHEYYLTIK